jgi:hypothetical protein
VALGQLRLRFVKPATRQPRGPVVFAVMRNEHYFAPHFFAHYRAMGVDGFLIYDDQSDEAALAFLADQPDCAVITSDHSFGDVFGKMRTGEALRLAAALKMSVPEQLAAGRWVLTVDADEFLVLPPPFADLPQLIEALEARGQLYLTAAMVDCYGETLNARHYDRSLGPFDGSPWFDVGPYYQWPVDALSPPGIFEGAGVRQRLLRRLQDQRPQIAAALYAPGGGWAKLWKVPLLKSGAGVGRISDHELDIVPATDLTGALAHFKFYPDLDAKLAHALAARQYHNASAEYVFLQTVIDAFGDDSLLGPQSRRFEGAESLVGAGLISCPV